MVDYKYKDLFYDRSVKKSLRIYNDDETFVLTNSDIHYESFELTESICSEQNLVFGSCEPSMVKFRVSNIVTSLKNQWLTVSETLEGGADKPFLFGRYKVFADELTSDRKYRDITAYDALHDALEADLTAWYNTLLPSDDSEVTQKQFRDSLFEYLGIEQEDIVLPNDDMVIQRTIQPEQLFGYDVLTALCEINGCFGHIGRDGKFQYIHLKEMVEGLYPSDTLYPSDDLYPADPLNAELISKSHYVSGSTKYEDFETARINKLQIRNDEDDIGRIYPDTEASENDNCYIVQGNFLVYGKSSEELEQIAANLYSVISKVWYRPAHVEAKGNPCLEVGDGIRLATRYEIVYTYILQRTLKGIQALRDTYDAEGEQYQQAEVNGSHAEIQQLKGKTNKLTRTIEETRLEMEDIEKGLSARITANASSIEAEVRRALGQEVELAAAIKINADNITAEVSRAVAAEEELSASISLTAEQIRSDVSKTYETIQNAKLQYSALSSSITQTAESLRLEVTERTSIYNEEINTLQGGMEGSIDLTFFEKDDSAIVATMEDKQCINHNGNALYQDVSLPAGTYLFSYEWLRSLGLYINATVEIQNLSQPSNGLLYTEIYYKFLGDAFPEEGWHQESLQFKLSKTSRIRFITTFSPPIGYEDRVNDLYLTNIALYGTAQSVADAVTDVKAELMLQSDKISQKVSRGSIISEINQTAEAITIAASKIDLIGLVNAQEIRSEFASLDDFNAISGSVEKLETDKLDAREFTAENISAMNITVESANITGPLSAEQLSSGELNGNPIGWLYTTWTKFFGLGTTTITDASGKTVSVLTCDGWMEMNNIMLGTTPTGDDF